MRKLLLDPSELRVETFELSEVKVESGTVHGNVATDSPRCTAGTLGCGSCEVSCNHTTCPADCETQVYPCEPIYVTWEDNSCETPCTNACY
jgi:hypothetical protein